MIATRPVLLKEKLLRTGYSCFLACVDLLRLLSCHACAPISSGFALVVKDGKKIKLVLERFTWSLSCYHAYSRLGHVGRAVGQPLDICVDSRTGCRILHAMDLLTDSSTTSTYIYTYTSYGHAEYLVPWHWHRT